MTRVLLALAFLAGLYGAPALTLRPAKAVFAAGEGVRLLLHVRVDQAGQMEPVELNRAATRIHLRGPGREVVLTGEEHLRLFPSKRIARLGEPFAVRAGEEWDTELDLLQYARPLAAGAYSVFVEFGGGRSGTASFTVAPGAATAARWTWIGSELGGIYAAGGTWFHTARAGHDLSVVLFSVPVRTGRVGEPRLARFAGIAGMLAERVAVWTEGAKFCWMGVTQTETDGAGAARCLDAGLGAIRIAEPALQTLEGELRAVVFAGDRMAEVRVPFGGSGRVVAMAGGEGSAGCGGALGGAGFGAGFGWEHFDGGREGDGGVAGGVGGICGG